MNSIYIIILLMVISITIICFGVTGLIALWLNIYNKYLKQKIYDNKKEKVINKLTILKDIPEDKRKLYENKINKYELFILKDSQIQNKEITLDMVGISERIKSLIDNMIEVEVYSTLRQYISLNSKYDILNLDKDIQVISTKVFNGLNKKILNTELVFSKEYIMSYIIGQSFNLALRVVTDLNASIIE